jgi:hypothetical protein
MTTMLRQKRAIGRAGRTGIRKEDVTNPTCGSQIHPERGGTDLCLAAVVPLFIVASDWSRWFYVTTSLLTLIHFAALRHTCVPETAPSAVTGATRSAG